jgi:CheY-like chemotaxis protein
MASTASPARVLVVDDEPPIRAMVRGFLEREGFIVAEAADGPAAVEQVRAFAPDIVVLDIMLPGLDALEVLLQKNRIIHGPVTWVGSSGAQTVSSTWASPLR